MTDIFYARGLTRKGRKLGDVGPYLSRDSAVAAAWAKYPNAKSVSSCRGVGMDMRFHGRHHPDGPDYQNLVAAG